MFELGAGPGLLLHILQEIHVRKVKPLITAEIEKMDDDGYGQGKKSEKKARVEEAHRGKDRSSSLLAVRLCFLYTHPMKSYVVFDGVLRIETA